MSDEITNDERYKRFAVKPYVIPDGRTSEQIGEVAARRGIVLHELTPQQASLEDAFMRLTGESVEFHAEPLERAA